MSLKVQGIYKFLNLLIMRKLSLKNLKLEASEMLGRNELKTVLGGYGVDPGSCGWRSADGSTVNCGYSYADVSYWVTYYGGYYCCQS